MKTTNAIQRYSILDVPVDAVDLNRALDQIADWLVKPGTQLRHVVTVNPEFVIAARRDPAFRNVLQKSSMATADGIGIPIAARLLALSIRARVTGVDLVEGLAQRAPENARLFLLGAGEGVAAETADVLRRRFPAIEVVGTFSGSSRPEGFPEIERRLVESGATLLLVAFGHPAQDLWINAHRERLHEHGILVAVGVGGAFDYLSGRVPRAPRFVRRVGLEWLYRLVRQPWRWRRQLALPLFVILIVRERLRRGFRGKLESS